MESQKISKDVSYLFLEKMGIEVAERQQIGVCVDGRLLVLEKDKKGAIIGFELI